MCSKSAKGLWMDFLAFVFDLDAPGRAMLGGQALTLDEIAYAIDGDCAENAQLLSELEQRGVLKKDDQGVYYSKRMAVEYDLREGKAQNRNGSKTINEQRGKQTLSNSNSVSTSGKKKDERFAEFWALYPRKVGRAEAKRRWVRSGCDEIADDVIAGLVRCKASKDWQDREAKFLPYPATWLNSEGWHDQPDSGNSQDARNAERKAAADEKRAKWSALKDDVKAELYAEFQKQNPRDSHLPADHDIAVTWMKSLAEKKGLI